MQVRGLLIGGGGGLVLGIMVAASAGLVILNIIIPWEDICAAVTPMQRIVATGSDLLTALHAWLSQAGEWLALRPGDAPAEAKEGLGGLLDAAKGIAGSTVGHALDVLTAPLRALVAVAAQVIEAVQAAVDAARDALAAVDEARCK